MKESFEEILEAMWKGDEASDSSLEGLRRRCPIEVSDDDLDLLERRDLIMREPGRALMTPGGRTEARGVVRRHRLAEVLFGSVLDLDLTRREEVACQVEHALLPELEEAICTLLGHPNTCPHGKPITPGRCCTAKRTLMATAIVSLVELRPGDKGRVSFLRPKDHARLVRLSSFGLTPGVMLEVVQRSPAFCVRFEGTELALDRDVAEDIHVARVE